MPHHTLQSVRDEILELLTEAGGDHLKTNEISKALHIKAESEEYELVREALDQLVDEGEVFRTTRRRFGRKMPHVIVEGTIEKTRSGEWIVTDDNDPESILEIDSRLLWTALHGDRVRAKLVVASREGRHAEGEVVRVLERGSETVVGTLKKGREVYLDPDNPRIHRTITVKRRGLNGAQIGDKAVVRLKPWDDPSDDPEGVVVERLGRAGEMNAEILSIAAAFHLPHKFESDVLEEADAIPGAIDDEEIARRLDLRDKVIITIDPADARDFDDAISIEHHDNGDVTVGIHIADVGHYVQEGSALDDEAYRRGTSVYLVTGVIPMLPERLSNDLCSLRPNVDRLAYSVLVRLSQRGAIKDYTITKSVINSKRRFSYEEALEVLETGEGDYAEELLALNRVAHTLRAARHRKGSIDFDRPEVRFRLDEENNPVDVVIKRATESTKLIEDLMLLANRVVAEHIGRTKGRGKQGTRPFVYRIHDVPPKDKLLELGAFVRTIGLSLPKDNVQPKDIQKLVEEARGTEHEDAVNEMTLRSMAKAVYAEHNIGHFGLAFTYYTHFTSPIRRYPDLIVHRMLFEYEHGMPQNRKQQYERSLGAIADHCSERERSATEAERESIRIAEVNFLKERCGDVFEARVSGIAKFGLFAELKDLGIDGLVRMTSMRDDYYIYDERARTLTGRHSKRLFRLGDTIFVRIIRVDEIEARIDMELIDEEEYRDDGAESIDEREEKKMGAGRKAGAKGGKAGSERKGRGTKGSRGPESKRSASSSHGAGGPRKGKAKGGSPRGRTKRGSRK